MVSGAWFLIGRTGRPVNGKSGVHVDMVLGAQ